MGDLLKLAFSFYLISLSFSAFSGVLRFLGDIKRFKDKEEKFQTEVEFEKDIASSAEEETNNYEECEGVNDDVRTVSEHNTPIIF